MEVVCLFRTDPYQMIRFMRVFVWKYTILVVFGSKCHEMEGGWCLVWNSSFASMISHTTFYRNKDLF